MGKKILDENVFTPGYDQPSYNLISEFDKSFDALLDGETNNNFMNIEGVSGLEHQNSDEQFDFSKAYPPSITNKK